MKFIASAIITAALAFGFGLYFPWWTIVVAGMLTGFFIPQHWGLSFLSAFTGVFLLWGIMALFISISNDHILAKRISLLVTKNDSPNLIILLTAMIGGLTAGLSSSTSSSLRNLLKK
jgi:hypothetical protein